MLQVTDEAMNFIKELIEENGKEGHGIRIYLAGMGCSGPQFGMAFQEEKKEEDIENEVNGTPFYYDEETKEYLKEAKIDYVETPQGSGLAIQNLNMAGCDSCSACP